MNKKWLPLILIVLLLAACNQAPAVEDIPPSATTIADDTTPADDTAVATPAPISRGTVILADGDLKPQTPPLALGFTSSGRLLAIHVQPGDQVAAGDPIATLDDANLQQALSNAIQQVAQAENSLAQAQLSLDNLLNWEQDETAVAAAEANLAAAEANLASAETQDSVAGNSLTSARIRVEQAERSLAQVQDAYETAFDPGREWELYIDDPSCLAGQEYPNCTGIPYSMRINNERDSAERGLVSAQESLEIARAEYTLALSRLNNDTALDATTAVANARQALEQATTGPKPSDIAAAELQVAQAELSLAAAETAVASAQQDLSDAELSAPWDATVLSVEIAPGALVGSGTPIVTLIDTSHLQFHTANLSERDLSQVIPGLEAAITLKTYPGETLSATVVRIQPQASGLVGDAATFTVVLDLAETDLDLRAGMTGRVEIRNE